MNRIKSLAGVTFVVALVLGMSTPAWAHDPIFVEESQTTPDTGPYMPDGTISWALYGSVLEDGDTRGFEFDLRDGDELYVGLLIPNLEPELSLSDEELPILQLEAPDGSTIDISPDKREVFDEPFSQTSYVTLSEIRQPGQEGRYKGVVTGAAPARFTVAIGETEIFFTETERSGDRPSSFEEISGPLRAWYSTPPGETPDVGAEADATGESGDEVNATATDAGDETAAADGDEEAGEIDLELVDEAMESGAASDSRDDDSSSLGFVAPLLVTAVLAAGLVFFVIRRRSDVDAA